MESRKDNLAVSRICRFCLSGDNPLTNIILDKNNQKKGSRTPNLPMKILMSLSVECFPSDKMPMYICNRCSFFMDVVYKFKTMCREADNAVAQFLHDGTQLEPIKWIPSLSKIYNTIHKQSPAVEVMEIEGGPTVQVSQDGSDSEDDGENVYNVTIGDGPQGKTSACVKVITGSEPAKARKKSDFADAANEEMEGLEVEQQKVTPKLTQEGSWACDECNNSYPLQQLLELHKMQKHRPRNFVCDICEAKFVSKYDLEAHMMRHNQDVQFQCVACGKNFKRDVLLRRHERTVHPQLLKYKCASCPASYIEKEDLTAHTDRHHLHSNTRERKHMCAICSKKFYDRYSLTRHQHVVHAVNTTLACEYCPERFNSVSKLTRHVRSHAGEKAYPCKFCDKRFTKSHHCTRHIRIKHSDVVNNEEFRCEQCNIGFSDQDELIYHSACHATVNCICPLCQEKFPNVDAVTAHIKTHVAGNEFMCDYCELVFTSNEKLDGHVMSVHAAELDSNVSHDEDSMDLDMEDELNGIQVKEVGDSMIVEIKKPNNFMISTQVTEDKMNYTYSEESEPDSGVTEEPQDSQPATVKHLPNLPTLTPAPPVHTKVQAAKDIAVANVVQRADEMKRKTIEAIPEKKVEKPKVETDKSLRLLEKELQELQRTNKREEPIKTPSKPMDTQRNRRPQVHTSTPKIRPIEEKKTPIQAKTPMEKKTLTEKRDVKENKRPEEYKEKRAEEPKEKRAEEPKEKRPEDTKEAKVKNNSLSVKEAKSKEEKETKSKEKNVKTKEEQIKTKEDENKIKEEEITIKEEKESNSDVSKEEVKDKSCVKNSAANRTPEEGVRRSSRANKVKDYAKMVQNRCEAASDDDSDDSDDEEYVNSDKSESRQKRKSTQKVTPKAAATKTAANSSPGATPARKRGRPRKNPIEADIPTKIKKNDSNASEANVSKDEKIAESKDVKTEVGESTSKDSQPPEKVKKTENEIQKTNESSTTDTPKAVSEPQPISLPGLPTAALKKVPMKALPPGVKPLPLPTGARRAGEISEMQIGKKVVKVQKIVLTKSEVEYMTKNGLLEVKDGTMVLKPGVKLGDSAIKSMVGESPVKPTPSRCDLDA